MFINTCTFSLLFIMINVDIKTENKKRRDRHRWNKNRMRGRERANYRKMMSWLFNRVDICWCWWDLLSLFYYFSIAMTNISTIHTHIYLCNPFYALRFARQIPSWTCKKWHKRKYFLGWRSVMHLVYRTIRKRRIICTIMMPCRLQFLT